MLLQPHAPAVHIPRGNPPQLMHVGPYNHRPSHCTTAGRHFLSPIVCERLPCWSTSLSQLRDVGLPISRVGELTCHLRSCMQPLCWALEMGKSHREWNKGPCFDNPKIETGLQSTARHIYPVCSKTLASWSSLNIQKIRIPVKPPGGKGGGVAFCPTQKAADSQRNPESGAIGRHSPPALKDAIPSSMTALCQAQGLWGFRIPKEALDGFHKGPLHGKRANNNTTQNGKPHRNPQETAMLCNFVWCT